jgi:hypothetical protein
MQTYGLYSPLDTNRMSGREIASVVIAIPFLLLVQVGIVVVGTYFASQNMNTLCDSFSLFRLSTWLFASAGIALTSFFFGAVYFYLLVKRRWQNFAWTILNGLVHLLSILWSVVGLMLVLSTAADCQQSAFMLWSTVIGVFVGQWVSCISYIIVLFLLFL